MDKKLTELQKSALKELEKIKNAEQLQEWEIKILGRKGAFTEFTKLMKDLSDKERPVFGKALNEVKTAITKALNKKKNQLENSALSAALEEDWVDITVPGHKRPVGHIHPISRVQREVEEIFASMGFEIHDGPEIESEYYNFEGLNIPAHHPARDMQDTFFIKQDPDKKHGRLVLRTHTSPVQVRTMERYGAPLRIIVPGRVFRYEATDASHDTTFYQVEGLLIDKNISIASLKGIMKEFLTRLFGHEVEVRFRPGYFPFVEPGIELDFSCLICNGKGCRVCEHTGWVEFMGAGMVHPNVLKSGGINPEEYQGWAFGFGLTRLVMMRYGITDIRLLSGGDTRFLRQF